MKNIEEAIIKMSTKKAIKFCMSSNLIHKEVNCIGCSFPMKLEKALNYVDKVAWRCYMNSCSLYQKRVSIRKNTFFDGKKLKIKRILQILILWGENIKQSLIMQKSRSSYSVLRKIINEIIDLIRKYCILNPVRLGGYGNLVEIDETMLNFKVKSHRGRSPANRTDALCIIEYNKTITKCFATCIRDKSHETILPIINKVVIPGSKIYTDEHKTYQILTNLGFSHGTVCHKYEFINKKTSANTQAVESFNNYLKYYIKFKKGLEVQRREDFLIEFMWKFNNRGFITEKLFDLIKV
ncbi:hypothetical protein H312_00822 [Anncaliia algerae PRA339]|uniref:ISXO2-like transposase domain-containing protein n=1 Tax=Anncaliia algerae PRA339 TaxID=1288291 RepID=A0A059F3U9_9MICR|nr:hypothetical protein H312_00822 [Anncaliia algerae PRA339]